MSDETRVFLGKMLDFFPLAKDEYLKLIQEYGEVLETILIEDVFMPQLISLLSQERDKSLLRRIFDYFEEVSTSNDSYLVDIFWVTVLETLGNDKSILNIAKKYMGEKTTMLQCKTDEELGRIS